MTPVDTPFAPSPRRRSPRPFPAALALLACGWAGLALAARPMITDDARVVEEGACQVETWARKSDHSTDFWALPACNFGLDTEVTLGGAHVHGPEGRQTSDVVLQAKHLLRPIEGSGWGTAIVVGYAAKPATYRQSELLGDFYATLLNSFELGGPQAVVHTNVGYLHLREAHADRLTWGLGAEVRLASPLWLIAESFGQSVGRSWWQGGVRVWLVPDRVQFDATVGERWGGGERWFTLGLRLISPRFMR